MSIATEITSIENNIRNAYNRLFDLGIDTDNIDKNINNISSALETVYNNSPKTEYQEGTEITIEGARKGKLELQEKGNLEQETTNGYNVLKLVATTIKSSNSQGTWNNNAYTLNGITFNLDINSNDVVEKITISGTSTQQATFYLYNNSNYLASGSYLLSGCSNGSNTTYDLRSYNINNTGEVKQNFTTPVSVTSNGGTQTINFALVVRSGQTISNAIIYPMLESGSTAHNFEKYTGGLPSPNPSYEQPISVVTGENIVIEEGKNKLDITYAKAGYTINQDTGEDQVSVNNGCGEEYIKVKPNTTYTLSAKEICGNLRLSEYTSEKVNIKRTVSTEQINLTITTTANTHYVRYSLNWNNTSMTVEKMQNLDLMLAEGTDTTYEPYHTPITKLLSLGDIFLAKIGTYEDVIFKNNPNNPYYNSELTEGKWYKLGAIGKLTANEITSAMIAKASQGYYFKSYGGTTEKNIVVSNAQTNKSAVDSEWNKMEGNYISHLWNNYAQIYINTTRDDFISWLRTIGFIMYFVLATPTYTEITNTTLIQQLEDIDNMQSYNGTTIITSSAEEGNAQMIFKGRGLFAA